jgi:hypothetical protein
MLLALSDTPTTAYKLAARTSYANAFSQTSSRNPAPSIDHSECAANHAPWQFVQLTIIRVFCVHRLLHLRWNTCFATLRLNDCGCIDGSETQQMPEALQSVEPSVPRNQTILVPKP